MSPKEKAMVIIERFHQAMYEPMGGGSVSYVNRARQCAKICVQEIIAALPKLVAADGYGNARFENPDIEYYKEVLKAIDTI